MTQEELDKLKKLVEDLRENSVTLAQASLTDFINLKQTPSFQLATGLVNIIREITETPLEALGTFLLAAGILTCYMRDMLVEELPKGTEMMEHMLRAGAMLEACNTHLKIEYDTKTNKSDLN